MFRSSSGTFHAAVDARHSVSIDDDYDDAFAVDYGAVDRVSLQLSGCDWITRIQADQLGVNFLQSRILPTRPSSCLVLQIGRFSRL